VLRAYLLLLLANLPGWAQNDMIANIHLQFRFINPGARSQAMGGAFVGLADDPTAVLANPAGLTRLRRAHLGLELASNRWNNEIPFHSGTIRQTGLQDFAFDLEAREYPSRVNSLPFLCYISPGSALPWGVFYAEAAHFQRDFQTESVVVPHEPDDDRDVADFTTFYFFPSRNSLELSIRQLGVSLARNLGEHWSVGLTLCGNRMRYEAATDLIFPAIFPSGHPLDPYENQEAATIATTMEDDAFSAFLGILFQPTDRFALGLAYKRLPRFDYQYQVASFDLSAGSTVPVEEGRAPFHLPDSYSAGLSFKSADESFLVSLELARLRYSELVKEYHQFFDSGGYTQDLGDQTEYRIGMEYFFTRLVHPLALRLGYWYEPYHALKNTFLDTQILYRDENRFQQIRNAVFLQRFEENTNHLTAGIGLSWTKHWVLDLAGDWSETHQGLSLSAQYRF
jgi:hypothetical protein